MRTLRQLALPAVAGLLLAGGLAADRPPPAHGSADAGAQIFATSCAACHAADASGGSGPPLTNLRGHYATDADIRAYIAANMPANKPGSLSAEQYTSLAQYLAGMGMNGIPVQAQQTPPPTPPPEPKPEPPPPVLKSEPAPAPTPRPAPAPSEPTPAPPIPEPQPNPSTTPSPTQPVPTEPPPAVEKTTTPAPVSDTESSASNDQSVVFGSKQQLADPPTVAPQAEPTPRSRSWLYGLLALSGVGLLSYIIWKRQTKER